MSFDLRCADCMTVMTELAPGSVDAVITSPPYNLGINYSDYDDRMPRTDYMAWLGRWAVEVKRVLSEDGSVFLNLGGAPSDPWVPFYGVKEVAEVFQLQNVIHWIKSLTIGKETYGHFKPINSQRFLNDCHEFIFHFTKTGKVPLDRLAIGVPYMDASNLKRGTRGKNGNVRCRGNNWMIPYDTIQSRDKDRPHPATFPVTLPLWCLKLHGVDRCCLVMDPFMGLGTTGMACKELGLNFLGVEIDPDYYAEAQRRLEKV